MRATIPLLLLATASCVTPSASVTDLTGQSLESARSIASQSELAAAELERFVSEVERNEVDLLEDTREKIGALLTKAMTEKVAAKQALLLGEFDAALWKLVDEEFEELVERGLDVPLDGLLRERELTARELEDEASAYPGDKPAQGRARAAQFELRRDRITLLEQKMKVRKVLLTETLRAGRERFERILQDRFAPHVQVVRRADVVLDTSYSSVFAEPEPEAEVQTPPPPVSYAIHRDKLAKWREAMRERLSGHVEALDTVDRYLRGRQLSFLFAPGTSAAPDLDLPAPPSLDRLGLEDVLAELRESEDSLDELVRELRSQATLELSMIRKKIEDDVRAAAETTIGALGRLR